MEPTTRTDTMGKRRKAGRDTTSRIRPELIDEVLGDYRNPEDVKGLLRELTAAVVNRAMQGELSSELGYAPGEGIPEGQTNRRNGSTSKRVRTTNGEMQIEVPRDREGKYEPQIVGKHQRQFNGFMIKS